MELYIKQIDFWGEEHQKILMSSSICFLGSDVRTSEVAKVCILGGIKEITIVDNERVTPVDLDFCFYLTENLEVPEYKCEALKKNLQLLCDTSKIIAIVEDPHIYFTDIILKQNVFFDCIICNLSVKENWIIQRLAKKHRRNIIASFNYGYMGYIYSSLYNPLFLRKKNNPFFLYNYLALALGDELKEYTKDLTPVSYEYTLLEEKLLFLIKNYNDYKNMKNEDVGKKKRKKKKGNEKENGNGVGNDIGNDIGNGASNGTDSGNEIANKNEIGNEKGNKNQNDSRCESVSENEGEGSGEEVLSLSKFLRNQMKLIQWEIQESWEIYDNIELLKKKCVLLLNYEEKITVISNYIPLFLVVFKSFIKKRKTLPYVFHIITGVTEIDAILLEREKRDVKEVECIINKKKKKYNFQKPFEINLFSYFCFELICIEKKEKEKQKRKGKLEPQLEMKLGNVLNKDFFYFTRMYYLNLLKETKAYVKWSRKNKMNMEIQNAENEIEMDTKTKTDTNVDTNTNTDTDTDADTDIDADTEIKIETETVKNGTKGKLQKSVVENGEKYVQKRNCESVNGIDRNEKNHMKEKTGSTKKEEKNDTAQKKKMAEINETEQKNKHKEKEEEKERERKRKRDKEKESDYEKKEKPTRRSTFLLCGNYNSGILYFYTCSLVSKCFVKEKKVINKKCFLSNPEKNKDRMNTLMALLNVDKNILLISSKKMNRYVYRNYNHNAEDNKLSIFFSSGLIAQEIFKICSSYEEPHTDFYFYDLKDKKKNVTLLQKCL